MWLFTDFGFFSAVRCKDRPATIVVRARAADDLINLVHRYGGPLDATYDDIVVTPRADYGYRLEVLREAWAQVVAEIARDVDYGNFKDSVAARQGKERAKIYGEVWLSMLEVQYPRSSDDDSGHFHLNKGQPDGYDLLNETPMNAPRGESHDVEHEQERLDQDPSGPHRQASH